MASRILAYPNVAAYEIIAGYNDKYNSLSGQLYGLGLTPIPAFDIAKGTLNGSSQKVVVTPLCYYITY